MLRTSLAVYGWLNWVARGYQRASSYIASSCGLFVLIDTEESEFLSTRPIITKSVQEIQNNMFIFFCIFLVLAVIAHILTKKTSLDVWKEIKFILDRYQEKCFPDNKEKDLHRVTLFRLEKRSLFRRHWSSKNWLNFRGHCRLFSNFLVPVLRSGHINGKSNTFFQVGSDQNYEGVAGLAFRQKSQVTVKNLPDLSSPLMEKVKDRKRLITEYAQQTNCKREMIEKWVGLGKTVPRSIAATPVEVNGQIWGVLVLDSTSPETLSTESVSDYTVVIAVIGKLLERM